MQNGAQRSRAFLYRPHIHVKNREKQNKELLITIIRCSFCVCLHHFSFAFFIVPILLYCLPKVNIFQFYCSSILLCRHKKPSNTHSYRPQKRPTTISTLHESLIQSIIFMCGANTISQFDNSAYIDCSSRIAHHNASSEEKKRQRRAEKNKILNGFLCACKTFKYFHHSPGQLSLYLPSNLMMIYLCIYVCESIRSISSDTSTRTWKRPPPSTCARKFKLPM